MTLLRYALAILLISALAELAPLPVGVRGALLVFLVVGCLIVYFWRRGM